MSLRAVERFMRLLVNGLILYLAFLFIRHACGCAPYPPECDPKCLELVCPNGATACVCGDADAECIGTLDAGAEAAAVPVIAWSRREDRQHP